MKRRRNILSSRKKELKKNGAAPEAENVIFENKKEVLEAQDSKSMEAEKAENPKETVTNDGQEEKSDTEIQDAEPKNEEPTPVSIDGLKVIGEKPEEQELIEEEEPPLTKEEKAHRRRKIGKVIGFIFLGIFGFLAVVYLGFALFFNSHFYFFTEINGNDFGLKSIKQIETFMSAQVKGYELTLQEKENQTEIIKGSDIDATYAPSTELAELLKTQNPFFWPKAFWEKESLQAQVGVQFNEEQLDAVLKTLNCTDPKGKIESVSATLKFDGKQYAIEPEVIGTQIDSEIFKSEVIKHIEVFENTLDMTEAECYIKPRYLSTSEEIIAAGESLNDYLRAEITYDVAPQTEVVDATVISEWLSLDENLQVHFNLEGVRTYVEGLAAKYNTIGTTRTFTTAAGNVVDVEYGNYGWDIDEDAEYELLAKNLQNREVVKRQLQYSSMAAEHGVDNDYGKTYVEVDLSSQYLWFFQDGEIVLESHIVTGKPSAGDATPQGSYKLTYKTRNAVLRGERYPDGTYEYESPVAFWMPFNGGIGFHDASWQAAFGGGRYLTHGSHGCVNMPYTNAEQLYYLLQDNTPIILHY